MRDVRPTARLIQRAYLLLLFGNTLAASFIWGINTIFLLDAGLSNLEAFAANAFFTAGMVLFEVPTGIVADTVGRRASYLLGTVTLTVSTLLYVLLWQIEAPFWQWAVASMLLGLGFTFFSGAVEAWLVDAPTATGFTGDMESGPGRERGQRGGDADRRGRGRVHRPADELGGSIRPPRPGADRDVRDRIQAHARRRVHPQRGDLPLREMRTVASASIEYGWRVPAVKAWLSVEALFTGGVGFYAFYALQPYLLELYGDLQAYQIAGLGGRDRRRRADPRRGDGARIRGALPLPHLGADRERGTQRHDARVDRGRRQLLGGDRAHLRLGAAVRGLDADSPGVPERPDPVAPAGDDPLVRLADELGGAGPAGARSRRRRLGVCAVLPRGSRDLGPGAPVPRTVETTQNAAADSPELTGLKASPSLPDSTPPDQPSAPWRGKRPEGPLGHLSDPPRQPQRLRWVTSRRICTAGRPWSRRVRMSPAACALFRCPKV